MNRPEPVNRELWLQAALLQELSPVEAPAALWNRVQRASAGRARPMPGRRGWVLAGALAIALMILVLRIHGPVTAVNGGTAVANLGIESSDPVQVRLWMHSHAGIDVPLPGALQTPVRLMGASVVNGVEPAVQVRYRAGDREATLLVAKTSLVERVRHSDLRAEPNRDGKVTWIMGGEVYTLAIPGAASLRPEEARMACLLCHA